MTDAPLLTFPDPSLAPLSELETHMPFVRRHVGPGHSQTEQMVEALGRASLDAVIDEAVPKSIRMDDPLDLPPALSEVEVVDELRAIAAKNQPMVQMIGLGYYDTFTPAVIQRRVLENPGWYTAYTPYQPEISQGRLEALLQFPNDGRRPHGAADGERVTSRRGHRCGRGHDRWPFARPRDRTWSSSTPTSFPQTIAVLQTRARPLGIDVQVRDLAREGLPARRLRWRRDAVPGRQRSRPRP